MVANQLCTIWYMDIREQATTTASPGQVWAVLADLEAWPRWTPTFTAVRRLGECGPIGVGSRFEVEQPRLGRSTYEVTEWQKGGAFTWVSSGPGLRTTAIHRVRPVPDGAEVELRIGWSGPATWLARLLFGRLARRYLATELASLTSAAEAGRPAHQADA